MKNVLSSFNWIFTSGRRFQLLSKNLVIEIRVLTVISQKKTQLINPVVAGVTRQFC